MNKRLRMILSLLAAMVVGLVVGLHAQSDSAAKLTRLSEEKAEISKMDLVLLNTRVAMLQQMLKDDLALSFVPTSVSYDADKKKIRVSVHVDAAFLAKANANQLGKMLETRATSLCVAPELAEGNLVPMFSVQPPVQYCAIKFFTDVLGSGGHVEPKDVASFEDGKLALK